MKGIIESLLFVVGDEGLTKDELSKIMELDMEALNTILDELIESYKNENRGIKITILGNRLKLVTKKENKQYIQKMINTTDDGTLSQSALETLAIIAYNQPITRIAVDEIRGVSSSHIIRKLLYKDLICEIGRSEAAGRPILYGTTSMFLDYFGLADIKELPVIEVEKNDSIVDLYESRYNDGE